MTHDSTHAYLETEVLTATPQKLQLMMLSGAIRFAHQAQRFGESGDTEQAWESLLRCRGIVTQILCGIKTQNQPLLRQVAGIYLYLFRDLTNIQLTNQYERLAEIIPVLEEERETWRQLCELVPEALERPREEVREVTARDMHPESGNQADASSGAFSQASEFSQGFDSATQSPSGQTSSGGGFSLDA
ncbi:MAG: flagellar export chaperone FliS [Pirellulaceae bacterium]